MRATALSRIAVAVVVVVAARGTHAQITNGGFETGDFTGWNVETWPGSSGGLFVSAATSGPASGLPTVGPRSGTWYAITDQGGPGAYALSQQFTVTGAVTSAILKFSLSTSDWSGGVTVGPDFNPFGGYANQYISADLLSGSQSGFATSGILGNFFLGSATAVDPWHDYSIDITALLTGPGTYTLRWAEVDNQFFHNMALDDVSLDIVTTATPEPATITLVGLGVLAVGAIARRRRA